MIVNGPGRNAVPAMKSPWTLPTTLSSSPLPAPDSATLSASIPPARSFSLKRSAQVAVVVALSLVGGSAPSMSHTALQTQITAPGEMAKPADPYFARFHPLRAPAPSSELLLKKGDRLAIVGDSITEQKRYARMIETYITVTRPDLDVTVRNQGKGGEHAWDLPDRMDLEVLPFKPTIATITYGMNDSRYQAYTPQSAQTFHDEYTGIVHKFKDNNVRVIIGSDGGVSKQVPWMKDPKVTPDDLTYHLSTLRNEAVKVAKETGTPYADVFWNMTKARFNAQQRFGPDYAKNLFGVQDGVHPEWAGHVPMAYSYLKAMGFDGNIGTITMDLKSGTSTATDGHHVDTASKGTVQVTSTRYPFCADGPVDRTDSVRSGMQLVPFNEELNRFTLQVKGATAKSYLVTFGNHSRVYTREQLTHGINLASDFAVNPFSKAFHKVDEAVGAKQAVESDEVWSVYEKYQGKPELKPALDRDEALRTKRMADIAAAHVPVTYTIHVQPR